MAGHGRTRRDYITECVRMLERFEWDVAHAATLQGRIPDEWREVWQERTQRKAKVSFWIDEDVLKFFRSLGPRHGPRMNTVLRAFVYARLGRLIENEDLPASYREAWMGQAKPSMSELVAECESVEDDRELERREAERRREWERLRSPDW